MAARAQLVLGIVCFLLLAGCADSTTASQTPFPEEQSAAAFGTVRGDVTTARTITIKKPFVPGANVVLEDSAGPFSLAPGEPSATAGTGIQFSLRVIFDPTVPSLTQSSTAATGFIRIRFTKQDGSLTNTTLVSLTAAVEVPAPLVFQNTLDFGPTAFGESIASSFTVTNPNAATPLNLESAAVSGGAFTLPGLAVPLTVPPKATFLVRANYTPPGTGSHTANVSLTSNVGGPFVTTLQGQGIPSEVVTDFGFVPVDGFGETAWLEFTVSPEAVSIHFEIFSNTFDTFFALIGLEGPGGKVYENDSLTGPYQWTKNLPSTLFTGALFLQLPNSDDPDVELVKRGGTYRIRLLEFFSNPGFFVRITVEQRHAGRVSDGLLPLNVFIADGIPVTAAQAPTDPTFQTILATMDALLATRGLRVGDVSYFKLADPSYDDIGSGGEFQALQIESGVAPEARLNLFFVDEIFGGAALGVTGALPGIKRNGTAYSGVVVDYGATSAEITGATTAHEVGHYLGLFHTTEFDRTVFTINDEDLILDTPVCDLFEISVPCPTFGDSNLMWPFDLGFAIGLQLSRGQAGVIKNHPLVGPGTVPAPPARLAQGGGGVLPVGVLRSWCANCAGLYGR